MTFDEFVALFTDDDGMVDLAGAESARAEALAGDPDAVEAMAKKSAQQERTAWEKRETANLRKQFSQPTLGPELDLDVYVPLGNSEAVRLGDMNRERIGIRKELRIDHHLNEIRAFESEMAFWKAAESLIPGDGTIRDVV